MLRQSSSVRKVIIGILSTITLFIALSLIINLSVFDEKLNPEIVKALQPSVMPPAQENAYYATFGISAAADKDFMIAGIQLMQRYANNVSEKRLDELTDDDFLELIGDRNENNKWQQDYQKCQSRSDYGCLQTLSSQLLAKPFTGVRAELLFNRYDRTMQMNSFKESQHFSIGTPFPPFGDLMLLSQLKLASSYNSGDRQIFLQELAISTKFWRMVLEQSELLISKMVAVAILWGNTQFLSEFISMQDLSELEVDLATQLLLPLSQAEIDIGEAFLFEQRYLHSILSSKDSSESMGISNWLTRPFLQINATTNDNYLMSLNPLRELAKLPAIELAAKIEQARQSEDDFCCLFAAEKQGPLNFSPSSLYNLTGKWHISKYVFSGEDYIARIHDLNGLFNLVKLQISLRQIDPELIQQAINSSSITNPYTDKPIDWDIADSALQFDCLSKGSICRITL